MIRPGVLGGLLAASLALPAQTPDISGAWFPLRGGGEFAPPPATPLQLKPEYKAAFDARRAAERAANARGEQLASNGLCTPYGVPAMMQVAVYPTEIVQTPKQIMIIGEAFSEVRRVYMDKPQLPIDEVAPGYYGRSVGKWDGDTLVIDTVGIAEDVRGYQGMPHSSQMRITERIRRMAPDVLHDQITIEDPVVLEKPVTYTLAYRLEQDYEMVEFVCTNNREYIDENGIVRLRLQDK
jgi:hypothetical protein